MGLRSRLKSTVKSVLGIEQRPAPPAAAPRAPPPPSAEVSATPPQPAPPPEPEPITAPAMATAPEPEPEPLAELAPEPEPVIEGPPTPMVEAPPETVAQLAPEPEPLLPEVDPAPEAAAKPASVSWASDYETSDAPVRNAHYRARVEGTGARYKVRVYNEAEDLDIRFECEEGEYVLEGAERAGYELPYSCRSGGCLTCSAKTHAGTPHMAEQYVLEEEHQARGFVLLCCTSVSTDAEFESHQQDNIQ